MKSHHTVKLEVSIEADRSVSAVEGEGDIGHIRPPPLLKVRTPLLSPSLPFISCLTNPWWPKVKFVKNW